MIWRNFADVERYYGYAQQYIKEARETAIKYLSDVAAEAGSFGAMIDNKPALFVREKLNDEEKVIFYFTIGQRRELSILSVEELYEICKQVRQQRLVKEYGDDDEEKKEEGNESA